MRSLPLRGRRGYSEFRLSRANSFSRASFTRWHIAFTLGLLGGLIAEIEIDSLRPNTSRPQRNSASDRLADRAHFNNFVISYRSTRDPRSR